MTELANILGKSYDNADFQWRRKVVDSEEARTSEARRAEAGNGVLGEGTASPPPHQLGVWGSTVSSPSAVRGEAPAKINFCVRSLAVTHSCW